MPVVAFYLGCDWDRIVTSVDQLIPLQQRETVRGLAHEIDASVSAYVHGQSGVCLISGSYYAVAIAIGESATALLPAARRRAFSAMSAMAKNGRLACDQHPTSRIAPACRWGRYSAR